MAGGRENCREGVYASSQHKVTGDLSSYVCFAILTLPPFPLLYRKLLQHIVQKTGAFASVYVLQEGS